MANTQGSSDGGQNSKGKEVRRSWSEQEEEFFLASMKELVAQGWKSDNGFRPDFVNKLVEAMRKEFPEANIKASPHITSKITAWKKNHASLMGILSRNGVGFNLNGDCKIDCDNAQRATICNADPNAKPMRKKSWPMLEGWKEVFGKDRATGENAEDVMDAVNQLIHEKNLEDAKHVNDDYIVDLEENQQIDAGEDSACQSTLRAKAPKEIQKKRKSDDDMKNVCELLTEIHRDTNARLETLAKKIGYQADLGKARKEVFDMLNQFPGLSLDEKFDACEILVDKPERASWNVVFSNVVFSRFKIGLLLDESTQ